LIIDPAQTFYVNLQLPWVNISSQRLYLLYSVDATVTVGKVTVAAVLAAVVLDTVEVLVAVVVVVSVLGSVVPVLVLVLVIVVVVSVFVVVLLSIGAVVVAGAPVLVSAAPVPGLAVTVVGSPILVVLLEVDDVEEVGANDEPLGLDNGVADDGDAVSLQLSQMTGHEERAASPNTLGWLQYCAK